MKIILEIYDIPLAEISEDFSITELEENISSAKNEYPLEMRFYKKGLSGLLNPLETIVGCVEREDVKKEAGIKETDSLFEKLYKLAGLNIMPINGYSIKQA